MNTFINQEKRFTGNNNSDRCPFQIDRGRVTHSEAFRRLQSKTQVLQTTEGDFHRTRLTHSIEVAQIGRSIASELMRHYPLELEQFKLDIKHDVIEAICLAHDIGHPPFGHGGEVALNYMMRNKGGFEGNAQTFRVLTKLAKFSDDRGMDLTKRSLLGVIKYPCQFSEAWNNEVKREEVKNYSTLNQNEWEVAKSYYDSEREVFNWIMSDCSNSDQTLFTSLNINRDKNHEAKYKSFECSIMDLADDISYAVGDLEDCFALNLVDYNTSTDKIFSNEEFDKYLKLVKCYSDKKIQSRKSGMNLKWLSSILIDFFIKNIKIKITNEKLEFPYLRYNIALENGALELLQLIKDVTLTNVIRSPSNQQLVKNGQIIVCELYEVFNSCTYLLPKDTQERIERTDNVARVVCDYISGMTDTYAIKIHKKLFGSSYVSYFEM